MWPISAEIKTQAAIVQRGPALYLAWRSGDRALIHPALAAAWQHNAQLIDKVTVQAALTRWLLPDDQEVFFAAVTWLFDSQNNPRPDIVTLRDNAGRRWLLLPQAHPSHDARHLSERFPTLWLLDVTAEQDVQERLRQEVAKAQDAVQQYQRLLDLLPLPLWRCRQDTVEPLNKLAQEPPVGNFGGAKIASVMRSTTPDNPSATAPIVIDGKRRVYRFQEVGRPVTLGFATDVTTEAELTSELQRHIKAHHAVLQNLGTAIVIYGADRRIKFYNAAFATMFQVAEAWLNDEPDFLEVLERKRERRRWPEQANFPAYKTSVVKIFTTLIEPQEELLYLPDDTILRQVITPHPFGGLMITYEDVTSRLALERSYNTLIDVQRETLDNLYEGVAVFGSDGRLRLSNPAFWRTFGLTPSMTLPDPHLTEIIVLMREHFIDEQGWQDFRRRLMDELTEREAKKSRLERGDGRVLDYAVVPLPDGAVLLSVVDVTDRLRVEQALRDRAEALEAADRMKTDFIGKVSYSLRTPLNAIIGFNELLQQKFFGPLTDKQSDYVRSIKESSLVLLHLIDEILDVAALEAGEIILKPQPIDVTKLIAEVVTPIAEMARGKNIQLDVAMATDIGTIAVDPIRFKQILLNVLDNAVKFTPAQGLITITVQRTNTQIDFIIKDNGIGIPEADIARVFGRFERATNNTRQSGTGIGLFLVKRLMELHGGSVSLTSVEGQGTSVTLSLPQRL